MIAADSSPASPFPSPTMVALPEGLRYFIVRPDNSMTPLVPADQLPFQIPGISRQLTPQQLSKEKWEWVTNTSEPKSQFSVQAPASLLPARQASPAPRSLAPDHFVRFGTKAPTSVHDKDIAVSSLHSAESAPKTAFSFSRPVAPQTETQPPVLSRPVISEVGTQTKSLVDSIANAYPKETQRLGYPQILPPSGIRPDPKKKVYCTHWIKTGDCAFKEQGCLYKHEMPSIEKLKEIGFRQVPLWWKEKSSLQLRGPTWMERQRRMQEQKEEEDEKIDPAHLDESVRNVFKGLRMESGRDFKKEELKYPRGILDLERSDVLVDFEPVSPAAPPPSRRSSCASVSTAASAESEASSSMSSVQSAMSIKQLRTGESRKTQQPAVSTFTPVEHQKPATSAPAGKEKNRRPRQQADDADTRVPLPKHIDAPRCKTDSSKSRTGMGKSVHAVKASSGTKAPLQSKQSYTNNRTTPTSSVSKRGSKLSKEQPRREKKPRPAPAEKETLIESLI